MTDTGPRSPQTSLFARPGGLALLLCIAALVIAAAALWLRKPETGATGPTGGPHTVAGTAGNDVLTGTDGPDQIAGGPGEDRLDGRGGADTLHGGKGNDVLQGGDGDDWLGGDRGDDTVTGGAGADTFHSGAGLGLDVITDFNAAEGDRLELDPGTTYTVRQDGADTVVDLQGGRVVLKGVQASTLPPGWIRR